MQPAGLEKGIGVISAAYLKDPTDSQWLDTLEYEEWVAWMKKYNSSANVSDVFSVYGYSVAQTMVAVLKASGDTPRECDEAGGEPPQPGAADAAPRHYRLD
jgi:branched-chain amino acid transport system substrate-binding protein